MNRLTAPSALVLAIALLGSTSAGNTSVNGAAPVIFAPGIISGPANDGSPTFTPDGKTLLFTRSGSGAGTILESHLVNGSWTPPEIATFSGEWNDQHPSMAPDGSYLVFVSTRPVPGITSRVSHIWRVDRTANGWGTPVHLPTTVNFAPLIFAPSVAADGTIYFLRIGPKRTFQLYSARFVNGAYQQAQPLAFSSPATADVDPEIAPDQSFLVFASSGRRPGDTNEHLYIAFHQQGTWGKIVPIRYQGDDDNGGSNDNEPNIAPDGKTLYFDSDRTLRLHFPRTRAQAQSDLERIETWDNGDTNVWTISLEPWLANS
jgi:Tol biopolymer transport system component